MIAVKVSSGRTDQLCKKSALLGASQIDVGDNENKTHKILRNYISENCIRKNISREHAYMRNLRKQTFPVNPPKRTSTASSAITNFSIKIDIYCKFCNLRFWSVQGLEYHIKTCKPNHDKNLVSLNTANNDPNDNSEDSSKSAKLSCELQSQFTSSDSFPVKRICEYCSISCNSVEALLLHLKPGCCPKRTEPQPKTCYKKCPRCELIFWTENSFLLHTNELCRLRLPEIPGLDNVSGNVVDIAPEAVIGNGSKPVRGNAFKPVGGRGSKRVIGMVVKPDMGNVVKPDMGNVVEPDVGNVAKPDMGDVAQPDVGDLAKPFNCIVAESGVDLIPAPLPLSKVCKHCGISCPSLKELQLHTNLNNGSCKKLSSCSRKDHQMCTKCGSIHEKKYCKFSIQEKEVKYGTLEMCKPWIERSSLKCTRCDALFQSNSSLQLHEKEMCRVHVLESAVTENISNVLPNERTESSGENILKNITSGLSLPKTYNDASTFDMFTSSSVNFSHISQEMISSGINESHGHTNLASTKSNISQLKRRNCDQDINYLLKDNQISDKSLDKNSSLKEDFSKINISTDTAIKKEKQEICSELLSHPDLKHQKKIEENAEMCFFSPQKQEIFNVPEPFIGSVPEQQSCNSKVDDTVIKREKPEICCEQLSHPDFKNDKKSEKNVDIHFVCSLYSPEKQVVYNVPEPLKGNVLKDNESERLPQCETCKHCGILCSSVENLLCHIKLKHSNVKKRLINVDTKRCYKKCTKCGVIFWTESSFITHEKELCKFRVSEKVEHCTSEVSPNKKHKPWIERTYLKCQRCFALFWSNSSLKLHEKEKCKLRVLKSTVTGDTTLSNRNYEKRKFTDATSNMSSFNTYSSNISPKNVDTKRCYKKCTKCDVIFWTESSFITHEKELCKLRVSEKVEHCPSEDSPNKKYKPWKERTYLKCQKCFALFTSYCSLKLHEKEKCKLRVLKSTATGDTTISNTTFEKHKFTDATYMSSFNTYTSVNMLPSPSNISPDNDLSHTNGNSNDDSSFLASSPSDNSQQKDKHCHTEVDELSKEISGSLFNKKLNHISLNKSSNYDLLYQEELPQLINLSCLKETSYPAYTMKSNSPTSEQHSNGDIKFFNPIRNIKKESPCIDSTINPFCKGSVQQNENQLKSCEICGKLFHSTDELLNHKKTHINVNQNLLSSVDSSEIYMSSIQNKIKCRDSKQAEHNTQSVLSKDSKNNYMNNDFLLNNYKCDLCNLTFRNTELFSSHCESLHAQENEVSLSKFFNNEPIPICLVCGLNFETISQLEAHQKKRAGCFI